MQQEGSDDRNAAEVFLWRVRNLPMWQVGPLLVVLWPLSVSGMKTQKTKLVKRNILRREKVQRCWTKLNHCHSVSFLTLFHKLSVSKKYKFRYPEFGQAEVPGLVLFDHVLIRNSVEEKLGIFIF